MQLERNYIRLDTELAKKKKELADKIRPFIMEFLQDTAIPIKFIIPDCLEVTAIGDEIYQFIVGDIKIDTKR